MQTSKSVIKDFNVAIIGCGKLGTAVLRGILLHQSSLPPRPPSDSDCKVNRVTVTTYSNASLEHARRVAVEAATAHRVSVDTDFSLSDNNASHIIDANVIILACKAAASKDILRDPAVRQSLMDDNKRRYLVILSGGLTAEEARSTLYSRTVDSSLVSAVAGTDNVIICRAIVSIAASINQSMTIIAADTQSSIQVGDQQSLTNLFNNLGTTLWLPGHQLHFASALAASSLAFYSNMIAAVAEGTASYGGPDTDGIPIETATLISAQAARGTAGLILQGMAPADIVKDVTTKGGSTEAGSQILKNYDTNKAFKEAIQVCAAATARLSQVDHKSS